LSNSCLGRPGKVLDDEALWALGLSNPKRVSALIDDGAGFDIATSTGPVEIVKVEEIIP
jgi:hypothetical protein